MLAGGPGRDRLEGGAGADHAEAGTLRHRAAILAARLSTSRWTTVVPVVAAVLTAATWGSKPGTIVLVIAGAFLAAACWPRSTTPRSSPTASASRSARSCSPSR